MDELVLVEALAGHTQNGEPVIEQLQTLQKDESTYRLIRPSAFCQGIAKDDLFTMVNEKGAFKVEKRSGNLSIRIISKSNIDLLNEQLSAPFEKLGGEITRMSDRMLCASIHVSVGFSEIEDCLAKTLDDNSAWAYNNVFNPETGEPLNWWLDILNEH